MNVIVIVIINFLEIKFFVVPTVQSMEDDFGNVYTHISESTRNSEQFCICYHNMYSLNYLLVIILGKFW